MTEPREARLVEAFVRAADTLVADYDVVALLQQLVEDCVALLPVDSAALLLGDHRGTLRLVASTSEDVRLLEVFQLEVDEGPCLDAFTTGRQIAVPDLVDATSWPAFSTRAQQAGYRSVHALPMRLRDQVIGAFGLFDTASGRLEPADLTVAQALADVATIGVLHQRVVTTSESLNEQLQTALNTRIIIEQAKGVLAERGGIDVEEAFRRLRTHARRHGLLLTEVARGVVQGTVPSEDVLG